MNETQRAAVSLLAHCLFEDGGASSFMPLAPDDPAWEAVYEELFAHKVFSLADRWLDGALLADEALKARWKNDDYKVQFHTIRIMAAQAELCRTFDESGIEFVIMKGAAASTYYPVPFLRAMGDIDVLVRRCDFEASCRLMEKLGYAACADEPAGFHHADYRKGDVEVELHRRLGSVPESNESLIKLFEDGIGRRVTARIDRFEFPVLPAGLNGLVLLLHINQHLRVGLGLRQITDWMMFASCELRSQGYDEKLRPLLSALGLEKFAVTVTALCRRHLGLSGDFSWADGADEAAADELMEYVLGMGNFGSKVDGKGRIAAAYTRTKNPFKLIGIMQASGLRHWEAAQKHAILRPFAWLRQGFVTLREMRKNKIPLSQMKEFKKSGERNLALIERLGLTASNKLNIGVDD